MIFEASLSQRFRSIKAAYAAHQVLVDQGQASWNEGDPYAIADWMPMFSPIELLAWHDIRELGLPLWPQFPVGRFFVDFGNPVAQVAFECDGAAYHDAAHDAARDRELNAIGWTVYRAPGWLCVRDPETDKREALTDLLSRIARIYFPHLACAARGKPFDSRRSAT